MGQTLLLGASVLLTLLLYFPGNLNVLWPYAVDVDSGVGLTLYGPLKKIMIPMADIGEVEDSLFWQGYVVHLMKPRAVLTQFVIPWYFGSQREELIRTIQLAVSQSS